MSLLPRCSYCNIDYISNSTRHPYLLQCKHSVCNVCVQACIDKKSIKCDDSKTFDCEICKAKIIVKNGNINELPLDFYQCGVIKILELKGSKNFFFNLENMNHLENEKILIDHTCEKNKKFRQDLNFDEYVLECLNCNKSNSILMCKQCLSAFCQNCFDCHHSTNSQHEFCSNKKIDKNGIFLECPNPGHGSQLLNGICTYCKKLMCDSCLLVGDHKGHLPNNLVSCENFTRTYMNQLDSNMKKVEAMRNQVYSEINEKKTSTIELIKNKSQNFYESLAKIDEEAVESINELLKKIEETNTVYLQLNILNSELKRLNQMDHIILKTSAQGDTNPMKIKIESYLDSIETLNLNYETKYVQNETFDENNNTKTIDPIVNSTLPKSLIEEEKKSKITNDECIKIFEKEVNANLNSLETSCKKNNSGLNSKASQQNLALDTDEQKDKISEVFKESIKSYISDDAKINVSNSVDISVQSKGETFKIGSTIERIKIVYFESPGSIYVRRHRDISLFDSLSMEIDEYVNNYEGLMRNNFAVGDYVLDFNHSIFMWSRAKIIQFLETKKKNLVLLKYIDHGYTTVSKISLLKKCNSKFASIPPCISHCCLYNIKPVCESSDDWNECNEFVQKLADIPKLEMKIIEIKNDDLYVVDIIPSLIGVSLSNLLANLNLVELVNPNVVEMTRLKSNEAYKKYVPMKRLIEGEDIKAITTCFFKDTGCFYMRQIHDDKEIEDRFIKINNDLQEEDALGSWENCIFIPKKGLPCSANTIDDNNHSRWYRAIIKNVDKTSIEVKFVDTGLKKVVNLFDLRPLKNEYMKFAVDVSILNNNTVFKCKFFGIELIKDHLNNAIETLNEILNTENASLLTKIVRVNETESDNETHEIIIITKIDGEFKNLNQLFIEKKFAIYTSDKTLMQQLSDELVDKLRKHEELNSPDLIMRPKMASKPTQLDLEITDILKHFDKTFKTVLIDRKNSSFRHRFIVTNCISPSEIWISEAYNYEENLRTIHALLIDIYSKVATNEDSTLDDWLVNSLCVWKHSKYHNYKRGKVVQKNFADNTVKVVCLDTGMYTNNVALNCLFKFTDEIKNTDVLAKKCKLIGIEPIASEWGFTTNSYISETLNERIVYVTFINDHLIENEISEIEILIEVNKKPEYDLSKNFASHDEYIKFTDILNAKGFAFLTEKKSLKRPFGSSSLPSQLVDDLSFKMVLTHVDLNYEIHGYLNSNELFLSNLQSHLLKYYSNPSNRKFLKTFENGHSCICESNIRKNTFYRAHIVEQSSLKTNLIIVQSVDYGFYECLPKSKLYEVDLIYYKKPAVSLKFRCDVKLIQRFRTMNFDTLRQTFINHMYNIQLCEVKNKTTNEVQFIVKYLANDEVKFDFSNMENTYLKNLVFKKFYVPQNSEFEFYRVEIISIEGYNSLCIKYEVDEAELSQKQSIINDQTLEWHNMQYEINRKDYIPKKAQIIDTQCLYLARFGTDSKLYRARILGKYDDKQTANVWFIDYGNSELVKYEEIYDLAIDNYYNIPIQSTICTLRNIYKTPNENETTKDDREIDEMIISQLCDCLFITQNKYYAKFHEKINKGSEVEVFFENPNINSNACLAYQSLIDSNLIHIEKKNSTIFNEENDY